MLAATLADVARALRPATRPWWVIGSAAVVLLGGRASPADVDVLIAEEDAAAVLPPLGLVVAPGPGGDLFASTVFARWQGGAVPVEFMARLCVRGAPVRPMTRVAHAIGGEALFTPDRGELIAMLRTFGRPKDLARIVVLGGEAGQAQPSST